ncbi:sialate O-acetylesterase [Antarcticibacterium sp. 1MA-6-2]|uniref:sialate O-acetylesterase n=1 Tax=Antarcticibacterium sp. 1MA-6-2 TaxID=2908210 RepID=UPI001F45D4C2|nr:sialate O-acetylesterase [Antarcticibacterium sp. 1MA-6-2]UJH90799.1 sialate O-acetylesterase [Antarcticibacterium sp. 1MA-6-2]
MKAKYFLIAIIFIGQFGFAQDPNFHVYLSFGQSNMEGHAKFEAQDTLVNERFQVLQSVDCPELGREAGKWYPAVPPLSRCDTCLTPTDYFGRTLVQNLPEDIKVGVINVAVGGSKIELFDKDNYKEYVSSAPHWMVPAINKYNGNPYGHLVDLARKAQEKGVIKGILLHQGESNTGGEEWPEKVKAVYNNLLRDLNLNAEDVPLLAGEMVSEEQGGKCASMNSILARLPEKIPNAHIISSKGCEAVNDGLHFSAAGYRELGERYGRKMLSLL